MEIGNQTLLIFLIIFCGVIFYTHYNSIKNQKEKLEQENSTLKIITSQANFNQPGSAPLQPPPPPPPPSQYPMHGYTQNRDYPMMETYPGQQQQQQHLQQQQQQPNFQQRQQMQQQPQRSQQHMIPNTVGGAQISPIEFDVPQGLAEHVAMVSETGRQENISYADTTAGDNSQQNIENYM